MLLPFPQSKNSDVAFFFSVGVSFSISERCRNSGVEQAVLFAAVHRSNWQANADTPLPNRAGGLEDGAKGSDGSNGGERIRRIA